MKNRESLKKINEQAAQSPQVFKLAGYNLIKTHKKQMEFHACKKRNRWVFGGNRTGKTECGAVEAVWFARGIHPYRKIKGATKGWVVSLTEYGRELEHGISTAEQGFTQLLAILGRAALSLNQVDGSIGRCNSDIVAVPKLLWSFVITSFSNIFPMVSLRLETICL